MLEFAAALIAFLLSHSLPARSGLRAAFVRRFGEGAWLLVYSLVSILLLAWLISAAARAPYLQLWDLELWHYHVPLMLMLPASMLFVGGAASPNPLSIGFSRRPFDPQRPGIVGVTRHPLLWGFALWSFSHLPPNGDLVSVIMFGGFGLFSLAGMAILDRRRRRALGSAWERLAVGTSVVPFAGVLGDRQRHGWRMRDLLGTLIGGSFLYLLLLFGHPLLIGPDPAAMLR